MAVGPTSTVVVLQHLIVLFKVLYKVEGPTFGSTSLSAILNLLNLLLGK